MEHFAHKFDWQQQSRLTHAILGKLVSIHALWTVNGVLVLYFNISAIKPLLSDHLCFVQVFAFTSSSCNPSNEVIQM